MRAVTLSLSLCKLRCSQQAVNGLSVVSSRTLPAVVTSMQQPLFNTFATVNKRPRAPKYPFDPFSWKPATGGPSVVTSSNSGDAGARADGAGRPMTADEVLSSINTTLTPEQRERVEALKKTARGTSTVRSLYRDVPTPSELTSTGNFISRVPDNAAELIDYALTFVPPRTGARNSRRRKRMEHRRLQSVHDHHRRIRETVAAEKKVQERRIKQTRLMKQFQRDAVRLAQEAVDAGRAPASSVPYVPVGQARHIAKREAFRLMRDKAKMASAGGSTQ